MVTLVSVVGRSGAALGSLSIDERTDAVCIDLSPI